MVRVLHFTSDSNIGGAGRLLLHCLRHFDRDKLDVAVVLPRGSALIPAIAETGTRYIETDFCRDASREKGAVAAFRRIIREEKPHIVHTHSAFDARMAAYLCGVKSRIYTRHSVFEPSKRLTTFPGKQISGLVNNTLATRIIAVADAAADNLTATGVRADKITVILNGVEPLTRSSAEECAALRQSLGIGERDFVCGISARMEPYKGHADLLAAAKTVLEKRPDIKFLLMGTGSAEADVRRQAAEMGLEKSVIFTGFCSDVVPYYSIMDLSLNCSYGTEATSLALLEAMSLGLPTAATRFGGNPGVVADGENGILTPVRDPAAMAEVILRIASDKALYDRLSLGAKRIFAEKFTAAAMTRQIEKVYYEEAARCGFDT
ncbi:MAG: glycosyltransferase [Ruminococcaceae bacterium]|nr:glycosyltransferase [Oscillospiraceae bacterium]